MFFRPGGVLVEKQHAVSGPWQMFPKLDGSTPNYRELHGTPIDLSVDVHVFVRFVTEEFEGANDARVRAAFDCLEKFLLAGDGELHDWVVACLDALQNAACWGRYGSGAFARFLGPQTRALWEALNTFRIASDELDLADCSVLEAEIFVWRVVHEKARLLTRSC